jgi:outer membrane receptor for ferrienterochelin and colicins
MSYKYVILSFLLFVLLGFENPVWGQDVAAPQIGTITGNIRTSDNQPAEYICVAVKDTKIGTLTNDSGRFSLVVPSGQYILVVQSIVCHRQEIPVKVLPGQMLELNNIRLVESISQLREVIVTGQYAPQSMKNSVYRVRSITSDQIAAKSATNVGDILNCELGIRFSNDLATGESDIQLMGMSGQNVKILLDGIPLVDRGSTRQSLSQIDANNIERIELVEGPMSVIYGTDALAGVVNIITKKDSGSGKSKFSVNAKIQEETVGSEYQPFEDKGLHNEHLGLTYSHKSGWNSSVSFTRNDFGGWQGADTGRAKSWHPKLQYITGAGLGYKNAKVTVWYRLNYLNETINNLGDVNAATGIATDQDYITNRYTHQAQADWKVFRVLETNFMLSYQDYSRKTQTTTYNTQTGARHLTLDDGDQDESAFKSVFFRNTTQYSLNEKLAFQPGIEYKRDEASGERIQGNPAITDYSFFLSSEFKPWDFFNIKPGVRFSKNSTYSAPPIIPSVSIKAIVSNDFDLRLSYARGFRAPALRELYFWFFNASHSIKGNPDLEAEHSDSYTGSFTWRAVHSEKIRISANLAGFYNTFNNLITTALDVTDNSVYTYVNIDKFKTTGGTLDWSVKASDINLSLGFSYIGRYNEYSTGSSLPEFVWSPEINSSIIYRFAKIGTSLGVFYKFTGEKPEYETTTSTSGETIVYQSKIGAFNWVDINIGKNFGKFIQLNAGIKNLFDITTLDNTSLSSGAHNTSGPLPLSYGRSYFLGITFQL